MMADVEYIPLMVSGANESKHASLKVNSPYDGVCLGEVATADDAIIERALHNATMLFADRKKWLSVDERIAILARSITLLDAQSDALALGAAQEGGKPLMDSNVEMVRCIDSFRICIDTLRHDKPPIIPMNLNAASAGREAVISREPIGVVVAVSAFNHPLNLIAHQVGPAIAAGCPVIVKPAEETPLSCARLVSIFYEAGLPPEWCQMVMPESVELAEKLVTDPRVAFFSFIGSAKVGWYLRTQLAAGTRCALEHGGVAPVIVMADADIERALASLVKGAFYHAGQVCVSVQRIFVHHSIADDFATQLAAAAKQLHVGDPCEQDTEVGPLIRDEEVTRVDNWVQEAITEGAKCLSGGEILANQCYAPTVLYQPAKGSKVMRQEIFGPVVCVVPFAQVGHAIAEANTLPFAFQAAVYSQNSALAQEISQQLAASTVMINDHTAFRVDWMPFAGLKQSGLGVGGVPYTMADMQIHKMLIVYTDDLV